jgi:hypothetical protein
MGTNARYQATTQLTGAGLGSGGTPALQDTEQTTPININAPPQGAYTVSSPSTILVWPSAPFTFARVQLMPDPASSPSANAKTIKGVVGDTGLPGWTAGSVTIPAVPGGSIVIVTAGTETLLAAFS